MTRLKQVVVEIHRRSIWQVLGIYLVGAWVAYQVTLSIVDGLGLPDWVPPLAIILFIIGLPIVLATAFVQEGLPGAAAQTAPEAAAKPDPEVAPAPPAAEPQLHHRLFTWNRAITGGVLAFALLGVAVSGFMGMRAVGIGPFGSLAARGDLGNNSVLIAEFEPLTGDSLLARVVAEAFRVDISQSSLLHAIDRQRIRYALDRMGRPDSTRISGDVAREIAIRLGVGVLLEGEVGQAGGGYLLSARLVTPDSGRVLLTDRETAKDSTELLGAVDRLSRRVRERAGESLRTIRATPPLAQVTTSSLPALRLYMQARQAMIGGDGDRALQLHKQALELDSLFANAHRAVAVIYYNRGQRGDSMLHHFRAAIAQKDRLTHAELHHARGMYAVATGDIEGARAAFESLVALDSTDGAALINLGVAYSQLRNPQKAVELARRAELAGFKNIGTTYWNQVMGNLDLRNFDEAKLVVERAQVEHPTSVVPAFMRFQIALAESDFAMVEALVDTLERREARGFGRRMYQVARGKLDASLPRNATNANPVQRAWDAVPVAYVNLWVRGQPQLAAQQLHAVIMHPALDTVPAAERPDAVAAMVLAAGGDVRGARRLIDRFQQSMPRELRSDHETILTLASAFIDHAEGRTPDAIATMRTAQQRAKCVACIESLRGQMFEAAGMPDSAVASYERYINTGWQDRYMLFPNLIPNDPFLLALTHERAAILYDQKGVQDKSRSHYASFVKLWEHADPELQPRVRLAQERLQALSGERPR